MIIIAFVASLFLKRIAKRQAPFGSQGVSNPGVIMTAQDSSGTAADKAMSNYQIGRRVMLAIAVLVASMVLLFGATSQSPINSERIKWIGLLLIIAGIGGRMWSTLYIGGRKSEEIVQTGPYSTMRNPLYFFSSISAAGAGAQMGSVLMAFVSGVLCATAFLIVIRREEAYLGAKFRQPFRDYTARVPRFVPNPSLYRDEELVSFRPILLSRTLRDGLAFFISVPLFELIEALQNNGSIPVFFHLW